MNSEEKFELPVLTFEEVRVLGALIEKSKTTPDYYPMTLNGVTTACNQKSSRNPVVEFDEETVLIALDSLKRKGFVSQIFGAGSRTKKYEQNFSKMFDISKGGLRRCVCFFYAALLHLGRLIRMLGDCINFSR
jgi:uncharacterized protein YceH (UPF0502 family)